jgi:hypothetical protein
MYRASRCARPHAGQTLRDQTRTEKASKASAQGSGKRLQNRGARAGDSEAGASTVTAQLTLASTARIAPRGVRDCRPEDGLEVSVLAKGVAVAALL